MVRLFLEFDDVLAFLMCLEEEAEAGPAQPVVLSKPSYHSESTNALADELSAASEDVLQQQNTQRLGAMEFVSLTAEESAARKKELYHQNLIRTLGRKHQPSNQAAAPTGPNLAGPSFGPSLTRVTSGDEYDDDTAVALGADGDGAADPRMALVGTSTPK